MRPLRRIWKNNDKILLFIRRKIDSFYANNNLEIGGRSIYCRYFNKI